MLNSIPNYKFDNRTKNETTMEGSTQIALKVINNITTVLIISRDSLLKDLQEQFKGLDEVPKDVDKIFDYLHLIMERIGYDLENFEALKKDGKLAEALKKLVNAITKLVEVIGSLDDFGMEALIKLFDPTKDLVKAIISFKDIEWDEFKNDSNDFGAFMEESCFNEEFAKRIFDHILVTVLKNAKEVFGKMLEDLGEQLKDTIIDEAEDIKDKIVAELSGEAKKLRDEFKDKINELKKYRNYYDRTYQILSFLQIISEDKVKLASLVPQKAEAGLEYFNLSIPAVEINVIHWERLERLFTEPIDYFKEMYPVNNFTDAEELMFKIYGLVASFVDDLPRYNSLKDVLFDLLKKAQEAVKASGIETEIGKTLDQIKNYILDLIATLESLAIEFGKKIDSELKSGFDTFKGELESVINILKNTENDLSENLESLLRDVQKDLYSDYNKLKDQYEKELKALLRDIKFPSKDDLKEELEKFPKSFDVKLPKVLKDAAKEIDVFKDIKAEKWEEIAANLKGDYIEFFNSIKGDVSEALSSLVETKQWKAIWEELKKKLETEYKSQTAAITKFVSNHDDYIEIKASILKTVEAAVKGDKTDNPIDAFKKIDITSYGKIIKDTFSDIKGLSGDKIDLFKALNIDTYFDKLLEITYNGLNNLIDEGKISASAGKDKLVLYANKVIDRLWKEIRSQIIIPQVKPYLNLIEAEIKAYIRRLINSLLDSIDIPLLNNVREQLSGIKVESIKELAELIIETKGDGINGIEDGVKFTIKLYKALDGVIPDNIKADLKRYFPIPDLSAIGDCLPAYNLDVENKFLSVTVYKYPKEENKGTDASFKVDLNIQITAFVGKYKKEKENDEDEDEEITGVYIIPVISGDLGKKFDIGKNHQIELDLGANLNKGDDNHKKQEEQYQNGKIGLFIAKEEANWLGGVTAIDILAKAKFLRKESAGKLAVIESKWLDFTINDYPQEIQIGYQTIDDKPSFILGYSSSIQKGSIVLKLRQAWDFLEKILQEDIIVDFDTTLAWNLSKTSNGYAGFSLDGNVDFTLKFDIQKALGKLNIENLVLGISPRLHTLGLNIMTSFGVDIEKVNFSISNIGLKLDLNYMTPEGKLGDFDIEPSFIFPSGIGISIETPAVKGGGSIAYDKERGEFVGVLNITVIEKFSIGAIAIVATKTPDGGDGLSFMALIYAEFPAPGIPLFLGFSLTAIGGTIGVNRQIATDKITDAVYAGTVGTIFFAKDLENNLSGAVERIREYYPVKKDQFFFGLLGQISFAQVFKLDFGLLFQAPSPVEMIIVGAFRIALPDIKPLLKLNVYFAGVINDKGIRFDASIVDSEIVGISIYGDMAFRLFWGGPKKGFLFSAGGFHPAYQPAPEFMVPKMRRVGMSLNYNIVALKLEAYFALTSNSVQFGASLSLKIDVKIIQIKGNLSFDALFQWDPFRFDVRVEAGLSVSVFGCDVLAVSLDFNLAGPAKWRIHGKARFKILFISFSPGFDVKWGRSPQEILSESMAIIPMLLEEYSNPRNWRITSDTKENLVQITNKDTDKKDDGQGNIVLHPFGGLVFEQTVIPLYDGKNELEKFGDYAIQDCGTLGIGKLIIGDHEIGKEKYSYTQADFAPSLFKKLNIEDQLSVPDYELRNCGFEFTGTQDYKAEQLNECLFGYEYIQDAIFIDGSDYVIDDNYIVEIEEGEPKLKEDIMPGTASEPIRRISDNPDKQASVKTEKNLKKMPLNLTIEKTEAVAQSLKVDPFTHSFFIFIKRMRDYNWLDYNFSNLSQFVYLHYEEYKTMLFSESRYKNPVFISNKLKAIYPQTEEIPNTLIDCMIHYAAMLHHSWSNGIPEELYLVSSHIDNVPTQILDKLIDICQNGRIATPAISNSSITHIPMERRTPQSFDRYVEKLHRQMIDSSKELYDEIPSDIKLSRRTAITRSTIKKRAKKVSK
jgi:hypothetical protein